MSNPDQPNLVTLTTINDANFAEILKIALADESIECVIEGEHQAGMTGVFPIRVQVPEEKLAHAQQILASHDALEGQEDEDDDADEGE